MKNRLTNEDPFIRRTIPSSKLSDYRNNLDQIFKANFFTPNQTMPIDEDTKHRLDEIFTWALGTHAHSDKGILFFGDIGTGKTTLMKSAIDLLYEMHGDKVIFRGLSAPLLISAEKINEAFKRNDQALITQLKRTRALAIDDLGKEESEIMVYGTTIRPVQQIIAERYQSKRRVLVTTNCTSREIIELYGLHIADRLREMCFPWLITGESYRH